MIYFTKILILVVLLNALSLEKAMAVWREYCEMEESRLTWVFNSTIRVLPSLTCHNFTTFPKTFTKSEKVEVLNFGNDGRLFNNLKILDNGVMNDAFNNFPNLQRVYLSYSFITKIEKGAFGGGDKLISLTLSDNKISNLDLDVFLNVSNLEYLDLDNNPLGDFQIGAQFPKMKLKWLLLNNCGLKALEPTLLDNLVDLRSLDLGGNQIVTLEPRFFTNLQNLQQLKLEGNQFTEFDANIICGLKHLSTFTFDKNPLFCNCDVANLMALLKERNVYFSEPDCSFKTKTYIQVSNQSHEDSRDSSLCSYFEKTFLKESREPSTEFKEGYCLVWKECECSEKLTLYCTGYRNGFPKALGGLVNNVSTLWMEPHRSSNIKTLKTGELQQTGLLSLLKLRLGKCQIQIIENGAFRGGEGIEILELQDNLLTNLDVGVFSELENLKMLNLTNNPIHSFKKGSKFPALSNLQEVYLENCKLTTLEKGIFENLKSLQTIYLKQNQMKTLNGDVFGSATSIRGCNRLEDNPWTCKDFQFEKAMSSLHDPKIYFTDSGRKCGGKFRHCPSYLLECHGIGFFGDMKELSCSEGDLQEDLGTSEVTTEDVTENEPASTSATPVIIASVCAAVSLILIVWLVCLARINYLLHYKLTLVWSNYRNARPNAHPDSKIRFAKSLLEEAQAQSGMSEEEFSDYIRLKPVNLSNNQQLAESSNSE